MKPKGIHHIAVAVPNRKKLAEWFVDKMDMKILSADDFHTFVDTGEGQFITIFDAKKTQLHHLTIAVDDVDEAADELEKKGIKVRRKELYQFQGPDGIPLQISPARKS